MRLRIVFLILLNSVILSNFLSAEIDLSRAMLLHDEFFIKETVTKRGQTMVFDYVMKIEPSQDGTIIRYGETTVSIMNTRQNLSVEDKKYLMLYDYHIDKSGYYVEPVDSRGVIIKYLEPKMVAGFPGGLDGVMTFASTKIAERWSIWTEFLRSIEYHKGLKGNLIIDKVSWNVESTETDESIYLEFASVRGLDESANELGVVPDADEKDIEVKFTLHYEIDKNAMLPVEIRQAKMFRKGSADFVLGKSTLYHFNWSN